VKHLHIQTLLLSAALFGASITARADEFFASKVIDYQIGSPSQPGFLDSSLALGGPRGGGNAVQSVNTTNLGVSGQLTLGFDDPAGPTRRAIANQAGADFIVFENPIYAGGDTTKSFAELMLVEVSSNGTDFARFQVQSKTAAPVGAFGTINPADVTGFAGVRPVFANTDPVNGNTIDPFDPTVAGGDAFDLSLLANNSLVTSGAVNLNEIRYVRLIDVKGDGSLMDDGPLFGAAVNPIYDPTGDGSGGADVDAISVIHGDVLPEPGALGMLGLTWLFFRMRPRRVT
jgi:hypothetical protein